MSKKYFLWIVLVICAIVLYLNTATYIDTMVSLKYEGEGNAELEKHFNGVLNYVYIVYCFTLLIAGYSIYVLLRKKLS